MRTLTLGLGLFLAALAVWLVVQPARVNTASTDGAHASTTADPVRIELVDTPRVEERAPAVESLDPAPSESEWPAHLARAGGIVLEVVDAKGAPRAGVKLAVELELWRLLGHEHADKYQHQDVVTDAAGRAPIAATRADEIESIELDREGAEDVTATGPFELAPGTTNVVRLLYPTRIVLKGRVLDFAGRALDPRARIELEPKYVESTESGTHRFHGEQKELRAKVDGRYSLELVPGWFTLGAATPGEPVFEHLTLHVEPEPSELVVDLRIPTHDRRVLVKLVANAPFNPVDAWVHAAADGEWPELARPLSVVARRHERLRFPAPRQGADGWLLEIAPGPEYELSAGAPDFESVTMQLPRDVDEVTLKLVRKPPVEDIVLRGRARGPEGPLSNGRVRLLRVDDLGETLTARWDDDGSFEFRYANVPGTRRSAFLLGSFGAAGFAGLGPIAIDHSRDDLELVVGSPLSLAGVIEGLEDPQGAELVLRPTASLFTRAERPFDAAVFDSAHLPECVMHVDASGAFAFESLAAGEYVLWVEPLSRRQPPARVKVRAGARDVRVRLGEGLDGDVVFDCRVVDAVTRLPIAGADVSVRGPDARSIVRGASGRTGADGRCELLGHSAGRWFVEARALDHAWLAERFVEYAPGRHAVEIALSPSCELDVELIDASGAPLADLEVCAVASDGAVHELLDFYGNSDGSIATTNIAGRARLNGLPAGPVRIAVGWSRGAPKELPLGDGRIAAEGSPELTLFRAELTLGKRARMRQVLR